MRDLRPGSLVIALALTLISSSAYAQLPALRDRPLGAAERVRYAALEVQFTRISQQRNTSVAAVRTIARALGERLATQNPDQIVRAIDERVQELSAARTRIAALERDLEAMDSMRLAQAVGPLLTAANAAIDAGELVLAESTLADAGARFAAARTTLQGRVDQLAGREAEILGQRAAVRRTIFDYAGAAVLFAQAADLTPAADPEARWRFRMDEAKALHDQGRGFAEPAALLRSVAVLRDHALPLVPRGERPVQWRRTQVRLVEVLQDYGVQQNDVVRLNEAATTARALVQATPRTEDAAAWADSQYALGRALQFVGGRTGDAAVMGEAVAALRAASSQISPDADRARWLLTQNMLGSALTVLAQDQAGAENAAAAVQVLQAAAARADRVESAPIWVSLMINLADALFIASETAPTPAEKAAFLERSIAADREALTVQTRERSPTQWARLQVDLGSRLTSLSEIRPEQEAALLAEARRAFAGAGEVYTRERALGDWANLQNMLGHALRRQGLREEGTATLEAALTAYRGAEEAFTRETFAPYWVLIHYRLAEVLEAIAARSAGAARATRYAEARAAYAELLPAARETRVSDELVRESEAAIVRLDAALAPAGVDRPQGIAR